MADSHINFGDIFIARLPVDGHVQGGSRPVLIAQNNIGNIHSPTVEVLPLSSQVDKAKYMPTHVLIPANGKNGLKKDSIVLAEQVRTINRDQLNFKLGSLEYIDLIRIGRARNIQSPFPVA